MLTVNIKQNANEKTIFLTGRDNILACCFKLGFVHFSHHFHKRSKRTLFPNPLPLPKSVRNKMTIFLYVFRWL